MQAVLTVAGKSSRLYPFGGKKHKSTISLLGKPLIIHTLESLITHGVTDVVIVDSPENGVKEIVDSFNLPCKITYVSHIGARGMGEAILDAKDKLHKEFLVIHAHHVDASEILPEFLSKVKGENAVLIKKESDLSHYGAVRVENELVTEIEEKPKEPSQFTHKIVGFYYLTSEFVDELESVEKHHYSFEEALKVLAKQKKLRSVEIEKDVISFKYPFHLFDIGNYLLEKAEEVRSQTAEVHPSATLTGKVFLGEQVKIMENAVIKGPVYLGNNVVVGNNAIVRTNVIVEEGSTVGANMELKETIMFSNSSTHTGYVGNSVIGDRTKIAAQFTTGNVRLDRASVQIKIQDREIDSKRNHLGAFIGSNVRIGINVSTMPGVIIGNNATVGPQTVVMQNVPDDSSYYSKFEGVVEKKKSNSITEKQKDIILFDIDYTLFDTGKFKASDLSEFALYDEVIDVLHKLGRNATLGIFSEGEVDFQKAKLVNTLIHAHFADEHLHIVSSKKDSIEKVLQQYGGQRVILVDDKIEVLELAKSLSNDVHTIWVKRGPFAESAQSEFYPDEIVTSLDEIVEVIKKEEK